MQKYIDPEVRIQSLEFSEPWKFLSEKERNYAYFMQKASWAGSKMVFHQISYEAPALFCIFQAYFMNRDFQALEDAALNAGVSQQDWKNFIAYVGGFYGNMSNYHSFGDMKFIPNISEETFLQILKSNPFYNDQSSFYKKYIDSLYPEVKEEIFNIEKPYTQLNNPFEGGVSAYYSSNITQQDLDLARDFLKEQNIDPLNTRFFKKPDGSYHITVGSIEKHQKEVTFNNHIFKIVYGEFSSYLEETVNYLEKAKGYAANEYQEQMIQLYIDHFRTGSIEIHKDSQRQWIKDKGPVVETNIGWIETYLDPQNIRAYYEGWVAVVDKEKSKKFQTLVNNSEQIINLLPWSKELEKDVFLAPDFTLLDIINFSTNSCPLGINIPNYDDIRENEGFKNVFLNNSMPSYAQSFIQFATPEQIKLLCENTSNCYQVHVACHELLGHGVGKLVQRRTDGSVPEFTDPITGEKFQSCYEQDETWNGKFGTISTSFEECRADTCGFYLCTFKEVYSIFGFKDDQIDILLWTNVMSQLRKGILGLSLYNNETKKWGQAHTQGAFVFTQYIYQNQKEKIIEFELLEDKEEFYIHLDKDKLMGEGRDLIKKFLQILQVYKSSGCIERASVFYQKYSEVNEYFLKIREIVQLKKKARRIELNNNLCRYHEGSIEPQVYPENFQGIILSYADRFPCTQKLLDQVIEEWNQYKSDIRVQQK